ncbi:MAG: carbohydrate-binding protein, partial [Myxococcota bacterium]|nr:carbohydrate-binding protein [Myxococcota bacterium]
MRPDRLVRLSLLLCGSLVLCASPARANPPIYLAFHWHMHQPIYWPYESVVQTADSGRYGFDVVKVHTDRGGPYTSWPLDAVEAGMNAGLGHLGAQVSFSGSLMENLDNLAAAGRGFAGWTGRWRSGVSWRTSEGNPRVDIVRFGYHHPLMPLVDARDIGLQLALHTEAATRRFGADGAGSRGIFPPETGFAVEIIPALVAAGIEWVIVDNIHFDRARSDYPYSAGGNLMPANPADWRNTGGDVHWVQLNDLWAPTKVAAPWGYQPHHAVYVDPDTGVESRIVVVPAARYEGNEDARGGYGAFLYERVLSQYEQYNTDPAHPMLVVLHHDGDNYGGGTDSYYHSNFNAFISWVSANPDRFVPTTVQDYLDRFPPAADDVIHVEAGSWAGADNGDAEFRKWNGSPDATGYSPDRASWAAIVAARNLLRTVEQGGEAPGLDGILTGNGSSLERAWHFLLNGETSCYWYWDGAENGRWDSHPARAANQAVAALAPQLPGIVDRAPPDLYPPQRQPYNPGGIEWGVEVQPSDFAVWTLAFDVSGLSRVELKYRVDEEPTVGRDNLLRAGGVWRTLAMTGAAVESRADPAPTHLATLYTARVEGLHDVLVDYYVEAEDERGNIARTPLAHVYVGQLQGGEGEGEGEGGDDPRLSPDVPCHTEPFTVFATKAGWVHWGIDGWQLPPEGIWPAGTVAFGDGKSVETPLVPREGGAGFAATFGPVGEAVTSLDYVFHHADGTWDNNGGRDYAIVFGEQCGTGEGEGEGEGEGSEGEGEGSEGEGEGSEGEGEGSEGEGEGSEGEGDGSEGEGEGSEGEGVGSEGE